MSTEFKQIISPKQVTSTAYDDVYVQLCSFRYCMVVVVSTNTILERGKASYHRWGAFRDKLDSPACVKISAYTNQSRVFHSVRMRENGTEVLCPAEQGF